MLLSIALVGIVVDMLQGDYSHGDFWIIMFVVLGVAAFVFQWMAVTAFELSGSYLTLRYATCAAALLADSACAILSVCA